MYVQQEPKLTAFHQTCLCTGYRLCSRLVHIRPCFPCVQHRPRHGWAQIWLSDSSFNQRMFWWSENLSLFSQRNTCSAHSVLTPDISEMLVNLDDTIRIISWGQAALICVTLYINKELCASGSTLPSLSFTITLWVHMLWYFKWLMSVHEWTFQARISTSIHFRDTIMPQGRAYNSSYCSCSMQVVMSIWFLLEPSLTSWQSQSQCKLWFE